MTSKRLKACPKSRAMKYRRMISDAGSKGSITSTLVGMTLPFCIVLSRVLLQSTEGTTVLFGYLAFTLYALWVRTMWTISSTQMRKLSTPISGLLNSRESYISIGLVTRCFVHVTPRSLWLLLGIMHLLESVSPCTVGLVIIEFPYISLHLNFFIFNCHSLIFCYLAIGRSHQIIQHQRW